MNNHKLFFDIDGKKVSMISIRLNYSRIPTSSLFYAKIGITPSDCNYRDIEKINPLDDADEAADKLFDKSG